MHTVIDIYRILHNKFNNNKFLFFSMMSRVHTCNEFKILKITKNVSCAILYIKYIYLFYYMCVCSYGFVLYYIFLFLF